jgi:hypothetical protein
MIMFEDGIRGVDAEETFQVKDIAELVAASMVTPVAVATVPTADSPAPENEE